MVTILWLVIDWTIGYRYQNTDKFYLFNIFGNIDFPEGLHLFVIGNKCHNNAHPLRIKTHTPLAHR